MTDTTTKQQTVLTVPEAAEILRVSRGTVYRMVQAGTLKASSTGGLIRITRNEVERFLGLSDA